MAWHYSSALVKQEQLYGSAQQDDDARWEAGVRMRFHRQAWAHYRALLDYLPIT